MNEWGWRVPLLIGCAIVPALFILRRTLAETEDFAARRSHPSSAEIFRTVAANWRLVGLGAMMSTLTTVCFYMITAYTPTFGGTVLKLANSQVQIVILCVGVSNFFWLPVMGALSDRIGRRPILFACTILTLATAYPSLLWLVAAPSFGRLLLVELWLSCMFGSYNGAMVVYLTEIMPRDVRTAGFSVAFSLATAIFGGFTPAICTYLIERTGNRAVPGMWLSFAALVALVAVGRIGRRSAAVPIAVPAVS
jgi:MFS family permease